MHLGQLVNTLAVKSGIDTNHPALKNILSNAEVSRISVPDDMADAIENNLYSLEAAKTNPDIKRHFTALAYNGLDAELNRLMDESGLDDTIKTELLAEKSSTKRAVALAKKIRSLEEQKLNAAGAEKMELQAKITALEAEANSALEGLKSSHDKEITNLLVKHTLSGYKYAMGEIPKQKKIETVYNLLKENLETDGLQLVKNGGDVKLVRADNTDYYDNSNNKIDFKTYVDRFLGQNKLLQATVPDTGKTSVSQNAIMRGNNFTANNKALSEIDSQLKVFGNPTV